MIPHRQNELAKYCIFMEIRAVQHENYGEDKNRRYCTEQGFPKCEPLSIVSSGARPTKRGATASPSFNRRADHNWLASSPLPQVPCKPLCRPSMATTLQRWRVEPKCDREARTNVGSSRDYDRSGKRAEPNAAKEKPVLFYDWAPVYIYFP